MGDKELIVLTTVYNKPDLLKYQFASLIRFLDVSFRLLVFDNSNQPESSAEFENTCKLNSDMMQYIKIPQEIHKKNDPSSRAGKSLDYSLSFVYDKLMYRGIVMVLDADVFLFKHYNPIVRLGNNEGK